MKKIFLLILLLVFSNTTSSQELKELIKNGIYDYQKISEIIKKENRPEYEYQDALTEIILLGNTTLLNALLNKYSKIVDSDLDQICSSAHFHLVPIIDKKIKLSVGARSKLFLCVVKSLNLNNLDFVVNNQKIAPQTISESIAWSLQNQQNPEKLLKYEFKKDWSDFYGRNLLHYSVAIKDQKLTDFFIKKGVSTKKKDDDLKTPKDLAKEAGIKIK